MFVCRVVIKQYLYCSRVSHNVVFLLKSIIKNKFVFIQSAIQPVLTPPTDNSVILETVVALKLSQTEV